MKLKKTLTALAVASALMGSTAASAAISLTNVDATITNWTGIDWNALGTALISGFTPTTGDTFTSTFWSTASLIYNGGVDATGPGLDTGLGSTGTYEYTIVANLNEINTFCSPDGSFCQFGIVSGTFTVYYDTTPDGNYITGAGMTDGNVLFSGVVGAQAGGNFTATNTTNGFGSASILASINYTNPAYISPDLTSANTLGTLQIGPLYETAGWVSSTGQPGAGGTSVALPGGAIVLQADMNSGVRAVPEPASLALMGIGLLGLGFSRRKSFKR